MEKLKLEIIRKVLMLDTTTELKNVREYVSDAISKECDLEDQKEQELLCYQIALLQVQVNCNEQLERIKAKLKEIKEDK